MPRHDLSFKIADKVQVHVELAQKRGVSHAGPKTVALAAIEIGLILRLAGFWHADAMSHVGSGRLLAVARARP